MSSPQDRPWTVRDVESATTAQCPGPGGGPGECCPACDVWHALNERRSSDPGDVYLAAQEREAAVARLEEAYEIVARALGAFAVEACQKFPARCTEPTSELTCNRCWAERKLAAAEAALQPAPPAGTGGQPGAGR